jgi:hypothetical protein
LVVPAVAIAAFGLPPLVLILLLLFLVLEFADGLLGVENLVADGKDEYEWVEGGREVERNCARGHDVGRGHLRTLSWFWTASMPSSATSAMMGG